MFILMVGPSSDLHSIRDWLPNMHINAIPWCSINVIVVTQMRYFTLRNTGKECDTLLGYSEILNWGSEILI